MVHEATPAVVDGTLHEVLKKGGTSEGAVESLLEADPEVCGVGEHTTSASRA